MQQVIKVILMVCISVQLAACSESKVQSEAVPDLKSQSLSAEVIHQNALVLDAHADIEIPGKEDRYVGADGRSKLRRTKCVPVVLMWS